MLIKTREQFYHPVTGRLPHKRADKGTPVQFPDHLGVRVLPSDAIIIEGTPEQKEEWKEELAERKARRSAAFAAGSSKKQTETMNGFIAAMKQMGDLQQAIAAAPHPEAKQPKRAKKAKVEEG